MMFRPPAVPESRYACAKCGSGAVELLYNRTRDILQCKCLMCQYEFEKEPADKGVSPS